MAFTQMETLYWISQRLSCSVTAWKYLSGFVKCVCCRSCLQLSSTVYHLATSPEQLHTLSRPLSFLRLLHAGPPHVMCPHHFDLSRLIWRSGVVMMLLHSCNVFRNCPLPPLLCLPPTVSFQLLLFIYLSSPQRNIEN